MGARLRLLPDAARRRHVCVHCVKRRAAGAGDGRQRDSDPREDGFVTWSCKQELYDLLWTLEDKVNDCSTYEGEEEFIKKRKIKKMMKVLSK